MPWIPPNLLRLALGRTTAISPDEDRVWRAELLGALHRIASALEAAALMPSVIVTRADGTAASDVNPQPREDDKTV